MADERDAFLREIDEEVRRERLLKLWDKYGVYVLSGAAAIVLAVFGWKWYESERLSSAARAGAQFVEVTKLISEGKNQQANDGFEQIAKEGPTGYAQLAQLRLAAAARKAGKTDEAVRIYEALAANGSADSLLRGFAQLQIATLKVDTASWTEMQNQLTDLVKEDSSWKYSARELMGLAAFKAGKLDEARKVFTELLASADTPATIRQRAQVAMTLVSRPQVKATQPKAPATPPATKDKAKQAGEAKTQ